MSAAAGQIGAGVTNVALSIKGAIVQHIDLYSVL
jgi:hypothetical protein